MLNDEMKAANVAAVTTSFVQDNRYGPLYEAQKDAIGGFPALWRFCAQAGEQFSKAEDKLASDAEFGLFEFEWISAVDTYVESLYNIMSDKGLTVDQVTDDELFTLAGLAIEGASYG